MSFTIIYLPTAEEVLMPEGMENYDRVWFENMIMHNHALYGAKGIFYPAEFTLYHYDIFDVVPKHLLEVIEV